MKYFSILLTYFILASFAVFSQQAEITDKLTSFGFSRADNRKVDAVIIHSTFNNSGGDFYDIELIIKQFEQYKVSSHYVIGRGGEIYRLVDEKNIAFHAGRSSLPDGRTAVNSCSIGIELMTSFTEAPTEVQIKALVHLINDIKQRYTISYVLRHSDIAPGRKTDPWNMKWDEFVSELSRL